MKQLGVINESQGDKIVALTPKSVEQLKGHFNICIEKDAGLFAGFTNEAYEDAGATIVPTKADIIQYSDVILSYGSALGNEKLNHNKVFIGYYNVINDHSIISPYIGKKTEVYSLDLIPRTTIAQSMDIISSVASISGYQAVLMAAEMSPLVVPMVTSAGGTLRPAKFLILGAGVAGLQAIATAKRLGAQVKAFDIRKNTKTEVESLGATFIEVEGSVESEKAGGYAVEQTKDYMDLVAERLAEESKIADVIITTAKIPGKPSPRLIDEKTVYSMKPGSIIIDLAAENGGNCALTRKNETIAVNGVTIAGPISLVSKCSNASSTLVSNNFTSFLLHYLKRLEANETDEILSATRVVEDGKIINERIISEINNH